jgi:hypothetical protein
VPYRVIDVGCGGELGGPVPAVFGLWQLGEDSRERLERAVAHESSVQVNEGCR